MSETPVRDTNILASLDAESQANSYHMKLEEEYRRFVRMRGAHHAEIRIAKGIAEISVVLDEVSDLSEPGCAIDLVLHLLSSSARYACASYRTDLAHYPVDFFTRFIRSPEVNQLHASGLVLHQNQFTMVAQVEVIDGNGRLVANGSGSFETSDRARSREDEVLPGHGLTNAIADL